MNEVHVVFGTLANPHTRKGKVRLVMAEQLRRLHDVGELAVATRERF